MRTPGTAWPVRRGLFAILAPLALLLPPASGAEPADPEEKREHPYLYFTRQEIPKLQARLKGPGIARIWSVVRGQAKSARTAVFPSSMVLAGGIAYNVTGDMQYAQPSIDYVMGLCRESSWGRGGSALKYTNLTTARKTLPVALCYDMLYHAMTEEQRERCREALRTKAYPDYMKAHARYNKGAQRFTDEQGHSDYWTSCYFNWNAWVNGVVGIAALATLDDIPESPEVLRMARGSLKLTHYEFDQKPFEDGGWDEGVMYSSGHMSHSIHFYVALERLLGTDDGFFSLPGVAKIYQYAIDFTAPDLTWVSFADCDTRGWIHPPGALYYLAERYDIPQFVHHLDVNTMRGQERPSAVLWRPPIRTPPPAPRPRNRWYRDIHWAILVGRGLYLPFKAGDLGANHGQNDANSFILWIDKERMLNDPGYGNRATEDHNCLLVNGTGQSRSGGRRDLGKHTDAFARILDCGSAGSDEYLVSDATACYGRLLKRYRRHVVLSGNGYVVVLDVAEARGDSEFTVNWHTLHEISKMGEQGALITGKSQGLHVEAAADSPIETTIAKARHDRAFRIKSREGLKTWRLFTVMVPARLGEPRVSAEFGAEARITVSIGGASREYVFGRTTDGGHRYQGGKFERSAPVVAGEVRRPFGRVATAGKKRQKKESKPIILPDGTEIIIVGGIPVRRRRRDAPVSKNDAGKSPDAADETTGVTKPSPAPAPRRWPKPEPEKPEGPHEPPEVTAMFMEAESIFIDGDSDKAAELFRKIVAEHPGTPSAAKAAEYLEIVE